MTNSRNGDDSRGGRTASQAARNVVEFSGERLRRRWREVDEAIARLGLETAAESRISLSARQAFAVEMAGLRSALTRGPDAQAPAAIEMASLVTLIRAVDYRLVKGISPIQDSVAPSLRNSLRQYLEATQALVNAYRRGAEHPREALNWIVREHEPVLERLVTGSDGQLSLGRAGEFDPGPGNE